MTENNTNKLVPIWEKHNLTITEASEYFNMGEKKMRKIVQEHNDADFLLYVGKRALIKRKKFALFIDEQYSI